jgi:phospholipid/cholesterol/gamma-HCH transport system permease protein
MNPEITGEPARIEVQAGTGRVRLGGCWVTDGIGALERALPSLPWPAGSELVLEAGGIAALDTAGAWLLRRLLQELAAGGRAVRLEGLSDSHRELLDFVAGRLEALEPAPAPQPPGALARLGRLVWEHLEQAYALLAFVGETALALAQGLRRPARLRWAALLANVESAGLNALPITGLLAFLIGVVIAYQGGVQLVQYGANIFVVELVTVTMLRELAPMMTAIIVAGRTGSAYTAQIGTMKVTEEIDAMRTIGIDPMQLLVLPKLLGLAIALPLLTVFADVVGILGGMVMSAAVLDVSMRDFAERIPQAVSLTSFLIGVGKAPAFAAIVATVGCFQGLRVSGGADSVGRQTTVSVVQAIFLVIVADAAFSVLFSWLGI